MDITLLTNLPIESGVGGYAYTLYDSLKLSNNVELINFPNYDDYKTKSFIGRTVKPKFKNRTLNLAFNKIVNKETLKDILAFHGIVHYTTHTMPVFKTNGKTIGTVHDFFPFEYKNIGDKWSIYTLYLHKNLKKILNMPNIIVSTSISKSKLIEEYDYNGKIYVVPYAVTKNFQQLSDKRMLRNELNLPLNKILILSVANNYQHKNLGILQKVIRLLGDNYILVRVGTAIGDSITFNYLDRNTLNKLYNACDILVFPSIDEGFGYPMIEAFATGMPVVASDISVFHEIGGDAPVYVNNKSPESIVDGIKMAFENKDEISEKSIERSKLYNLSALRTKMLNIYSKVLD